ncbi:hypothetical protein RU92_GL002209 [Lactococcus cremoris subsp. tructae]|uniref:Uncharacterized protein n=1 Tax=Lactococcus cremoris subsp. tructae TaxID=542833 RepID=A0A2A5SLY8_LACLC|nr:hypothetical protein RU92_GL002209 [Lactococcus cremoris subsp. tructae]
MRETFVKMYPHIQTIKQGKVLIGERRKNELIATSTYEKKVKEGAKRDKKVLGIPEQKVYQKKERTS